VPAESPTSSALFGVQAPNNSTAPTAATTLAAILVLS
jgi:hypothetical protein